MYYKSMTVNELVAKAEGQIDGLDGGKGSGFGAEPRRAQVYGNVAAAQGQGRLLLGKIPFRAYQYRNLPPPE